MSVEKPDIQEFINACEGEADKRKWFLGMAAAARTFGNIKSEQTKAERARDDAYKLRDAALAEMAAKQTQYEREMQAALADVARVTKERSDAQAALLLKATERLEAIKAQTVRAQQEKELAEGQRDAFKIEADRQAAELVARNAKLLKEEATIRERLSAALKT